MAQFRCPICRKVFSDVAGSDVSFLPFCSERCQLIDLGNWCDGRYSIPVEEDSDSTIPPLDD
ncbi:MAG: DNA gyrase inhibitor YacG [Sedimentisphaerales bacterium]|nr:DNA gyrase inhibitor YacG [Sedimentisphaerales bacterium]